MSTITLTKNTAGRSKIHAQKFALWSAMASIIMMFAALTSAYIVKKAAGDWLDFPIPKVFFISTVVMLFSSATMQMAHYAFRKQRKAWYLGSLITTAGLGLLFIILQYQGWQQLFNLGITINGNVSGSFFYVISGLHAAHILGGLAALSVALVHAFNLPFRYTPQRHLRLDLTTQYWHFVDFLWLYLLIFLLIQ